MPKSKSVSTPAKQNTDTEKSKSRDDIAMILGTNLSRLRRDRRMSVSEMARLSNTSKATLSNLETGTGNPTVTTLSAFAKVLGVTSSELLVSPAPRLIRAHEGEFAKGPATVGKLITRHHSSSVDIHQVVFKAGKPFESKQAESDAIEEVYVIDGNLRIVIADETFHLDPGDLIQYALSDGAEITAIGKNAKVIIVMSYTLRSGQSNSSFS